MKKVLVVAPHPDDETLGCGGTLLRHINDGDEVSWLIVTKITQAQGFSSDRVTSRASEINQVAQMYNFKSVHHADFDSMALDTYSKKEMVETLSGLINQVKPEIIYLPYRLDAHSDHEVVFDAVASCTKWFRYPYVKVVRAYETLSETEFGLRPEDSGFRPNLFINISEFIDKKIEIMRLYAGEMGEHPFPRSEKTLRALATLRGSASGCEAAEAFMTLKEIL